MGRKYSEIRSDYFDEEKRLVHIDAWKTGNDNEEGSVVAIVDVDTSVVTYLKANVEDDPIIKEHVDEVLTAIKENKYSKSNLEVLQENKKLAARLLFLERIMSKEQNNALLKVKDEILPDEASKKFAKENFKLCIEGCIARPYPACNCRVIDDTDHAWRCTARPRKGKEDWAEELKSKGI